VRLGKRTDPRPDRVGRGYPQPDPPAATGMEPEGLKRDFGDRLCFHGGSTSSICCRWSRPEAVRKEVQRRVKILGAGGGYILAPSHNLQLDISTENILAMYDPALRTV